MSALEALAQAILDDRVWVSVERFGDNPDCPSYGYRILVDDPKDCQTCEEHDEGVPE